MEEHNKKQEPTEKVFVDVNRQLSVLEWVGVIILTTLPIVNIIMLLVWAFSDDTNLGKKNYSRAALVIMAAWILVFLVLGASFFAGLASIQTI